MKVKFVRQFTEFDEVEIKNLKDRIESPVSGLVA